MLRSLLLALPLLALAACADAPAGDRADDAARSAVDRAIAAHGSERLDGAVVSFSFRERRYTATHDGGRFSYERAFTDSLGRDVRDVLDNDGVRRFVGGAPEPLTAKEAASVTSGVNSVIYFALLPAKLDDPAVRGRHLGTTTIAGEPYDEVEITFTEDGGGVDHDDRFVYWIHRERDTIDFLAYRFHVDGGGTRFREAFNTREVGGIRFTDYRNYTADRENSHFVRIEDYEDAFARGETDLYSEILTEDVVVRPIDR